MHFLCFGLYGYLYNKWFEISYFFSFIVTKVIIVIPGIKIIRNRKEELVKSKLDVDVDGAFPILYVLYFPESTATRANT